MPVSRLGDRLGERLDDHLGAAAQKRVRRVIGAIRVLD